MANTIIAPHWIRAAKSARCFIGASCRANLVKLIDLHNRRSPRKSITLFQSDWSECFTFFLSISAFHRWPFSQTHNLNKSASSTLLQSGRCSYNEQIVSRLMLQWAVRSVRSVRFVWSAFAVAFWRPPVGVCNLCEMAHTCSLPRTGRVKKEVGKNPRQIINKIVQEQQ